MEPAPGIEMPRTMSASTRLQAIRHYLTLLLTVQTSSRESVRDPGRCRTGVVSPSTASTRCFWNRRQASSAATPLVLRWRHPTRRALRFTSSLCLVSPLPLGWWSPTRLCATATCHLLPRWGIWDLLALWAWVR